jgi:hypothetical protein
VEVYRLLILDGHESHPSQDFKDYCLEYKGPILEGLKPITLSDDFDDMSEEEQHEVKNLRAAQSLHKLYEILMPRQCP